MRLRISIVTVPVRAVAITNRKDRDATERYGPAPRICSDSILVKPVLHSYPNQDQ